MLTRRTSLQLAASAVAMPVPTVPLIKDGKLRALAVTGKTRALALPDVPTMTEAGFPEIEGAGWISVLAPAGTPKAIITMLNSEIARIIVQSDVKDRLAAIGLEPVGSTPEAFSNQIKVELEKWSKVIRAGNIKPE